MEEKQELYFTYQNDFYGNNIDNTNIADSDIDTLDFNIDSIIEDK